jgi:hypothetical protein
MKVSCSDNKTAIDRLTQCSGICLEKVCVQQIVKKFHAFYGNRNFITFSTTARNLSPPRSRPNPRPLILSAQDQFQYYPPIYT